MDLDELFSATKQQDANNGTAKPWEEFAYPQDCNCINKSSMWLKEFAYGPKHCYPILR